MPGLNREIEPMLRDRFVLVISQGRVMVRHEERDSGEPPPADGSIRFALGARCAVSALWVTILSEDERRLGRHPRREPQLWW